MTADTTPVQAHTRATISMTKRPTRRALTMKKKRDVLQTYSTEGCPFAAAGAIDVNWSALRAPAGLGSDTSATDAFAPPCATPLHVREGRGYC
jgi:hypothetical protein